MKTYSPKPDHIERRWYVFDASGQVLGRLASEAATLLRGKHKPMYAPHMDTGDHVIVINADRIELTGGKDQKKIAYRHSGYPGGIKATPYSRLMAERPVFAVEKAIRGMLPKNRLGRAMVRKLHVVAGPDHPHQAQKPVPLAVGERPAWEGLPAPRPPVIDSKPVEAPSTSKASSKGPSKAPAVKKPTARRSAAKRPAAVTAKTTSKRTTATKRSVGEKPEATTPATRTKRITAKLPTRRSSSKKPARDPEESA